MPVVGIDGNEIVVESGTSSNAIIETVTMIDNDDAVVVVADKSIDGDASIEAEVFLNKVSTPKSLLGYTLIATPISTTPVQIGSVAFALPVEQHHYSPGLFSNDAIPSFRSAPDPPDSTVKKSISRKDPTGKSPKFRLQLPLPICSPPPVNKDEESWLQEPRIDARAKQMDYSTTSKCKKE
jgi:hypothetical protein